MRPLEAVIGWAPACECGWRGEAVTRAATPEAAAAAGPGARTACSKDGWLPEDVEDELIYPQWEAHVVPVDLAAAVSRAPRVRPSRAGARRGGGRDARGWGLVG